jgi:hypothetical protein
MCIVVRQKEKERDEKREGAKETREKENETGYDGEVDVDRGG